MKIKKSLLTFIITEIEIVFVGILAILVEYYDFSIRIFFYAVLLLLFINYILCNYEDKEEDK